MRAAFLGKTSGREGRHLEIPHGDKNHNEKCSKYRGGEVAKTGIGRAGHEKQTKGNIYEIRN